MKKAVRLGRHAPAHTVFFLLASLHAATIIPVWAVQWAGWLPGGGPLSHAHDMLLGFAAAIIGGFLFTRLSTTHLIIAVTAWLAGRLAPPLGIEGWMGALAAIAFPATLAVLAGLPFLRSARSGHNLVFFPLLGGLLLAEGLTQAGRLGWLPAGEARGIWLAFDLVLLLLLVMGGRIIPAAMAGAMRGLGESMADRNRPELERLCMAGMALAAIAHLFVLPQIAAMGWALAGIAGLWRLARWRFTVALSHPSLWPLHLGYGWLCGGLIGQALLAWSGLWSVSAGIHAATIGGLGTITATMMVRTIMQRDRTPQTFPRLALVSVGLISAAAVARLLAPAAVVAALAWSLAFAILAGLMVRFIAEKQPGPGPG